MDRESKVTSLDLSHEAAPEEQRILARMPRRLGGAEVEVVLNLAPGSPVGETAGMVLTAGAGAVLGACAGGLAALAAPAAVVVTVAAVAVHVPAALWDREGGRAPYRHVGEEQSGEGHDVLFLTEPADEEAKRLPVRERRVVRLAFPAKAGSVTLESRGAPHSTGAYALAAVLTAFSAFLGPAVLAGLMAATGAPGALTFALAVSSFVLSLAMFRRPWRRLRRS